MLKNKSVLVIDFAFSVHTVQVDRISKDINRFCLFVKPLDHTMCRITQSCEHQWNLRVVVELLGFFAGPENTMHVTVLSLLC